MASLDEDWDEDFDVEVTEEDIRIAQEMAKSMSASGLESTVRIPFQSYLIELIDWLIDSSAVRLVDGSSIDRVIMMDKLVTWLIIPVNIYFYDWMRRYSVDRKLKAIDFNEISYNLSISPNHRDYKSVFNLADSIME